MSDCRHCTAQPTVEVDPETGDVYVRILAGWKVRATEEISESVNVDYGDGGHVVGVEILR